MKVEKEDIGVEEEFVSSGENKSPLKFFILAQSST